MSILSLFYRWAMAEGYAQAEPFTYRTARALFAGTGRRGAGESGGAPHPEAARDDQVSGAGLRRAVLQGLRGSGARRWPGHRFRGRELARNAAVGELALATGLRLQEFTYLLVYEIPALPPAPHRTCRSRSRCRPG